MSTIPITKEIQPGLQKQVSPKGEEPPKLDQGYPEPPSEEPELEIPQEQTPYPPIGVPLGS